MENNDLISIQNIEEKEIYQYSYSQYDLEPVKIESINDISGITIENITNHYQKRGFVIFELVKDKPTENLLQKLADIFNLGEPYVPSAYKNKANVYESSGFNFISSVECTSEKEVHRAFKTQLEQKLHTDGTIEEIGKVKTSVLLCVSSSYSGGETILFNSVGAFASLVSQDLSFVLPFLDNNCLERRVLDGSMQSYKGPAFTIYNSEIISRFSIDNTSNWKDGFEKVAGLEKAFEKLLEMAKVGSPYYIETKLKENQGIIIANDKIAHGRKAYLDSNTKKRNMIRGLFLEKLKS